MRYERPGIWKNTESCSRYLEYRLLTVGAWCIQRANDVKGVGERGCLCIEV